jgi:thiosulfate dehydrogenase [quinone] large subunit
MQNPFNHPAWIDISLFLARLLLGLYMIIAGWGKMAGPGLSGFANGPFLQNKPAWLPDAVAMPYGYALPVLELLTGLLLVVGLFTRAAAGIMTLMLVSIAIAVITKSGQLSGGAPGPIHHSVIFTALAFVLAIAGSGRLAIDPLYFGGGDGGGKRK